MFVCARLPPTPTVVVSSTGVTLPAVPPPRLPGAPHPPPDLTPEQVKQLEAVESQLQDVGLL
jgi:hypothetical protein